MLINRTCWIVGVVALAGLGIVALAQQVRNRPLEAAEAKPGPDSRRHAPDSAAVLQPDRDLRALLAGRVYFGSDRWMIEPADAAILDEKVTILQTNPRVRIRIVGHSDERGAEIYNLVLGRRRAVAAKQYLAQHGVDASRIEVVSAGVGQPIDRRHNAAAWASNRRDEFELIDTPR
jgi:peptidoglycan-associated lipoprotein